MHVMFIKDLLRQVILTNIMISIIIVQVLLDSRNMLNEPILSNTTYITATFNYFIQRKLSICE